MIIEQNKKNKKNHENKKIKKIIGTSKIFQANGKT